MVMITSAARATSSADPQAVPPASSSACGTPLRVMQEQLVPALGEIERHGLAHDAETDEADLHALNSN